MPETIQTLIMILHVAAACTGVAASSLFRSLRARYPQPQTAPATPLARLGLAFLYAPRWSRVSVLALSGLLALVIAVPLALLEGHPLLPIIDALLSALISQIWHAATDLSGDVPLLPAQGTGIYEQIQARLDAERGQGDA
jgi:hypothetical protein